MKTCQANDWGDLVCPHCRTNLVTPVTEDRQPLRVKPGVSVCQFCSRRFKVTSQAARKANEATGLLRRERLGKALDCLINRGESILAE